MFLRLPVGVRRPPAAVPPPHPPRVFRPGHGRLQRRRRRARRRGRRGVGREGVRRGHRAGALPIRAGKE